MAEHIDNLTALLDSGGHRWTWGVPQLHGKSVSTMNVTGEISITTGMGGCPVTIEGVAKATGATAVEAGAAMDALMGPMNWRKATGIQCPWEDDQGRTGTSLVIKNIGDRRKFTRPAGGDWGCWSDYTITARELTGGPDFLQGVTA